MLWLKLKHCRSSLSCAFIFLFLFMMATLPGAQLHAQQSAAYPSKPVTLIVPYVPGGLPDLMARVLGQKVGELMKQSFVVDNKPGAGGLNAAQYVLQSEHDGYTLLVADQQQWAIDPYAFKTLPFNKDFLQDFDPITLFGLAEFFLAADVSLKAKDLKSFIADAKANPSKFSYGTPGIGSAHHLITEVFLEEAGIKMVHVPYKGGSQTDAAVQSGEVAVAFRSYNSVVEPFKNNKMNLFGVANEQRSSLLPTVPTFVEQGLKSVVITGKIGLVAPKGTPKEIVSRLSVEFLKALDDPDVKARYATMALGMDKSTPDQFAATIRSDLQLFGRAAKAANLQPE